MNTKHTISIALAAYNSEIHLFVNDQEEIQIKLLTENPGELSRGISLQRLMEGIAQLWERNHLGKIQVVLTETKCIVP